MNLRVKVVLIACSIVMVGATGASANDEVDQLISKLKGRVSALDKKNIKNPTTPEPQLKVLPPKSTLKKVKKESEVFKAAKIKSEQVRRENTKPVVAKHPQPNNDDEQKVSNHNKKELLEIDSQPTTLKLSELPRNSKFIFKKSIFIPANRKAMAFIDGKFAFSVMEDVKDITVYMAKRAPDDALVCAFLSSNNYLLLRGKDRPEKRASFLIAEKVKFSHGDLLNKKRSQFVIEFSPKLASDQQVEFKIECILPVSKSKKSDLGELTLETVESGFSGYFEFELPQFTEI